MADISSGLAWAVAVVFLAAGIGKLASRPAAIEGSLALVEVVLGLLLLLDVWSKVTALVVYALAISYMVYAFTRQSVEPCHCFGEHLPATTGRRQRTRNVALAFLAVLYAVYIVRGAHGAATPVADAVCGLAIGSALVMGPWAFAWASGAEAPA